MTNTSAVSRATLARWSAQDRGADPRHRGSSRRSRRRRPGRRGTSRARRCTCSPRRTPGASSPASGCSRMRRPGRRAPRRPPSSSAIRRRRRPTRTSTARSGSSAAGPVLVGHAPEPVVADARKARRSTRGRSSPASSSRPRRGPRIIGKPHPEFFSRGGRRPAPRGRVATWPGPTSRWSATTSGPTSGPRSGPACAASSSCPASTREPDVEIAARERGGRRPDAIAPSLAEVVAALD